MTLALPYSVQRFSRHVDDELAGRPGRSRADEGATRFFVARGNGYPISCFNHWSAGPA
jgi:hypothetical protein